MGRCSFRIGKSSLSRIFIAGQSRETGLYDLLSPGSLPGFNSGIITEFFQMDGVILVLRVRLNMSVKNFNPLGPRCFRCKFVMLSGPAALEDLLFLIALAVCSGVKAGASSMLFFLMFLDTLLVSLEEVCLITEEYCSLKLSAILLGMDIYLPLNLIAWL